MTTNGPNARTNIFSSRAFSSQPGVPPSIEPLPLTPTALPVSPQEALSAGADSADLLYLSELQLQPVEWLWQDRLAAGSLAMVSGAPGSGKTWLALAIAAALSRGRAPFTGEKLKPCNVLYASTEHAASDVIHPRFARLDGDLARLVVLRGPVSATSAPPASPALRDISILEDALQRTHAHLVILDPWHSPFSHGCFGAGIDLHHPQQTRALLDSLARLAERHRCCILLVRHLTRPGAGRPVHRNQASIEISAALRTEFLAGCSPDAPLHPALLQVKSNLGPLAPPLAYKIDRAGNFSWTGISKLTPEEMMAGRPTGAGLPKRKFVGEWLRQYLQDGSQKQYTIEHDAQREGVCIATLRRAKFDLGVHSAKDGVTGSWYWSLPPA